ncbi:MAG: response regulator transcription factor [Chloroflexota bacterium]
MTLNLLIAEDSRDVADVVAFGARMNWPNCKITVAADGAEALLYFEQQQPDLVVLDINMPPPDGFEVCRRIREGSQVPILVLTARNATLDKIRALDLGADDYITKPFDHLELLARLRALVRRANNLALQPEGAAQAEASGSLALGALNIDLTKRQVFIDGEPLALTSTEYRLLEELARHAGTVLPHNFLLERVWGPEYAGEDHYLKVFVRRLRRKLGDDAEHPRYIQTEWGVGYRFVPQR